MSEEAGKDEKTEDATPRRRQEAREKGQVPLSSELLAALLLTGWTLALAVYGGNLGHAIGGLLASTVETLGTLGTEELDLQDFVGVLNRAAKITGSAMGALLFGPDTDARGEYWPYGVDGSRTTLAAFLGFCFEQGLHPKRLEPEDLFAPETMMFHQA